MNLEKMTYLNKDGLRVTDSLIVASEYGIKPKNVLKTIRQIMVLENVFINEGGYSQSHAHKKEQDLFLATKYLADDNNYHTKFEITEEGFYALVSEISTNRVAKKT